MLRLSLILVVSFALLSVQSPADGQPTNTTSQSAATETWEPASGVPEKGTLNVLSIPLDFSASVQNESLAARSQTAVRAALHEVEDSTYVIAIVFGTYSRIVADRVISSENDRASLIRTVSQLDTGDFESIEGKTDVSALERTLKNIWNSIVKRYPNRPINTRVTAVTDGNPDPVDPESTQSFDQLLGQPTTKTALGEGLFAYSVTLHREGTRDDEEKRGTTITARLKNLIAGAITGAASLPLWIFLAIGIGALVLLGAGLWRHVRPAVSNESEGPVTHASDTDERRALSFDERITPEDGQSRRIQESRVYRAHLRIPLKIGKSADSNVVLRAPDAPDHLCQLQFHNGDMQVEPEVSSLYLDGEKIQEPVTVSAEEQHELKYQEVEVRVAPYSGANRTEDYFD
jgi:hypothetical protein